LSGRKLNVGCGRDVREGWVNLDRAALPGVDVVHDLEKPPLPFKDGEFDEVLCVDVLEHVALLPVMAELHRIIRKGGAFRARVPHFTSENNFVDPTHRNLFSVRTFEFFVEGSPLRQDHYFDYAFSKLASVKLSFAKGLLLHNHLVEPLVNADGRILRLYECTFLSRFFPAENVEVVLVK
jgi:SAM-dependent methyltransferase